MQRIVVLSDGTWCGRETGTQTNIYRLARLMGIPIEQPNSQDEYTLNTPTLHARYRHGVGLNSTFLDYLFNGITAQDIATECVSAYRFIVDHYAENSEIWLFGLSRGAYTVRCVAGMINNCGILRKCDTDADTDLLCREVYRRYRSRYDVHCPDSEQSIAFRKRKSWPLIGDEADGEPRRRAPVRFMGLLDTVGSLGIPDFQWGIGLEWAAFYDNQVSSVVDQVGHFVSLHDRIFCFQPCLASRKDPALPGIHEEWLPGVHYDLGRQRFRFFRTGASWPERVLANWTYATKAVEPNSVLADLALLKMLQCIQQHDDTGAIIPAEDLTTEIQNLQQAMAALHPDVGNGDVYGDVLAYGPFGSIVWAIFKRVYSYAPSLSQTLLALRDRLIPTDNAQVYRFGDVDGDVSATQPVAEIAQVTPQRYPSESLRAWDLARA
ncbi:hypothetical protein SCUCBS95973_000666 [Sporothrix curviconia]|uniref:T6SS Phospholipase effector Tle1-like catalytic domain-containing protein n=1 Tax=Sporothrix curviconia TaxID=1260050 RepID=A0ABP0AS67_9PEZI